MKKSYVIVLIICILSACSSEKVPDYVIPKDDMVEIIVDIHLTDGLMTMTRIRQATLKKDSLNLYDEIFIKYGYTREDFDTSIYYYSYNINKYDDIYNDVLNKLSEMEAKEKEENLNKESRE